MDGPRTKYCYPAMDCQPRDAVSWSIVKLLVWVTTVITRIIQQ